MKDVHNALSTVVGIALEDKGFALARRRGRVHAYDKTVIAPIVATVIFVWRADGLHPRRARWHVGTQDLQRFRRILELLKALAQASSCLRLSGHFGQGGIRHGRVCV